MNAPSAERPPRLPVLELLLIIGLPISVLIAGAITISLAMKSEAAFAAVTAARQTAPESRPLR